LKIQVTLTVPESKRVIARAISTLPEVQYAMAKGKILLKGGTTVSALSEILIGKPMRISGRITPRGAVRAKHQSTTPHSLIINNPDVVTIDDTFVDEAEDLQHGDVVVIGANALDIQGNAAMMAGAPLGGNPGRAISGLMAEGVNVIIAVGLEKLIPNTISEAVAAAGRKSVEQAYGMPVGMIPLMGRVVTEKEAMTLLAQVECTVISCGGIGGAEGATTMIIEGPPSEVEKVLCIVAELKSAVTSGDQQSLTECDERSCKDPSPACIYKQRESS
jgi:hypothetical protein